MKFTEYMKIRNNKNSPNGLSKTEAAIFGVEFTRGWMKRDMDLTEEQIQKAVLHVLKSKSIRQFVKNNIKPLYMRGNEGYDDKFLYLMENSLGFLKIGISVDPIKRARSLSTSSGLNVDLVCFWKVNDPAISVERKLHKLYSRFSIMGEWFKEKSFTIENIEENIGCSFERVYEF